MNLNIRKTIGTLLILIGIGMIGYFGFTYAYTGYMQGKMAEEFKQIRKSAKPTPKPKYNKEEPPKINPEDQKYYNQIKQSGAFGKLVIPKINLDTIIVEGTDTESLKKGPGHISASALPGQIGNTVISGHRVTFGAPFRNIDQLKPGDAIIIYTPNSRYVYQVYTQKVVLPTDTSVIQPTPDSQLTLTACHPPHSAKYRIIIQARLLK